MIWQETGSVAVIIMLTQTHEAGREKCFTYFPNDPGDDPLEIKPEVDTAADDKPFQASVGLSEIRYEDETRSTVRRLTLKAEGKEKIVWHYLFEGWPDFSIPEGQDRLALLDLVKQTAAAAGGAENPRVVHCSAGVGRSGTFIALDYLIDELNEGAIDETAAEVDRVADTVNELRKQRMMMVQGESQFHFLYEIMKEQWLELHGFQAAEAKKNAIVEDHPSENGVVGDGPRQ